MQVHYAQEVVPNALVGRELDVLAAVVLGGARLGGGRGTVLGCILGVFLVSVTQNGLNLLGISPYAFKMIVGAIILIAISLSNAPLGQMLAGMRQRSGSHDGRAVAADTNVPSAARCAAFDGKLGAENDRPRCWRSSPWSRSSALLSPRFLSLATFDSVAFQLPELGLLTLAMLMPIISGGINLAVTFTANLCGLTLAWVLQANGGPDAGILCLSARRHTCHRRRHRERPGDGAGDRLHRRAPDPRLAVDDDLPARPRRVPDARRRHFRAFPNSSSRSATAASSACRSRC